MDTAPIRRPNKEYVNEFAQALDHEDYALMVDVWRKGMMAEVMVRSDAITELEKRQKYKLVPDHPTRAMFLKIGLEWTSKKPAQVHEIEGGAGAEPLSAQEFARMMLNGADELLKIRAEYAKGALDVKNVTPPPGT